MTWITQPRSRFGSLAAISVGEGPQLVLIHGVGLRAEAWGAQLDALATKFRMVAVDMPGHGGSALPEGDMPLSAYTDAIAMALDGPAILVGHSMGAMIALDLAARYPDKTNGVCAMNAIFQRDPDAKRAVEERAACLDGRTTADPTGTLERWFDEHPSAERDACATWLTSVDPSGYRAAYRVFAAKDGPAPEALEQLGCPALFMTGSEEPNSTPAMSRAMAALAPHGKAQIIEGAAHMMPMTHAAEVNTMLTAFLESIE